jgi:dTDP-4-dehydrorhamnose reductase
MLGDQVLAHSRQSLDITDRQLVLDTIREQKPDVVINCAAWTDVDGCEFDRERAFLINAEGPENLAVACRQFNAACATISTDYVFDGTKEGFYTQADEPHPLSVYGESKLGGEERAQSVNPKAIVVRTGYVFGAGGRNFLSTVITRSLRGEKLKALADTRGTPTFADDLVRQLRELVTRETSGIFHLVNSGEGASFEDFVRLALALVGRDQAMVEPVTVASLGRPAPRPANSCMRCLRSASLGLPAMPDWQEALQRFVAQELDAQSFAGEVAQTNP